MVQPHAMIIGAGLAGLTTALGLAGRGWRVDVFDADEPGGGASLAAGGMLAPGAEVLESAGSVSDAAMELARGRRALAYWRRFERQVRGWAGADLGVCWSGTHVYGVAHRLARLGGDTPFTVTKAVAPVKDAVLDAAAPPVNGPEMGGPGPKCAVGPTGIQARSLECDLGETPAHGGGQTLQTVQTDGTGLGDVVILPDEGHVDPRQVMAVLVVACERLGVVIRRGVQVVDIISGGRPGVVLREGTVGTDPSQHRHARNGDGRDGSGVSLTAEAVVIAGGWRSAWFPEFAPVADVQPVKGQMLQVRLPEPMGQNQPVYRAPGLYSIPRANGDMVIGATCEMGRFDRAVSADDTARLFARAQALVPGLAAGTIVSSWTGVRPFAPRPLCQSLGGGVYAATGYFRNGVLLAPLLARDLAKRMTEDVGGPENAPEEVREDGPEDGPENASENALENAPEDDLWAGSRVGGAVHPSGAFG